MSESLRSLAYASDAAIDMDVVTLAELLLKAQAFNKSVDVTGLLLFTNGKFVQTIEGPSASIDLVYERIERDRQHRGVVVFQDEAIESRVYPSWAMMSNTEMENAALNSFLLKRLGGAGEAFTPWQSSTLSRTIEFLLDGTRAAWLGMLCA